MCESKVQHMTGRKIGFNRSRPVFFRFFDFSTNIATGNRKNSEFVQPQPVVRSFAVGFSPISVFFPVQRTGPVNTNLKGGRDLQRQFGGDTFCIFRGTFHCKLCSHFTIKKRKGRGGVG